MNHSAPPHVAVIGAGVAGLAAARQLVNAGIRVSVLEKNPQVGGRIHTTSIHGFKIDTGAEFLANFYPHTHRLIRETGLESEVVPIGHRDVLFVNGRTRTLWPFWPPVSLPSRLAFFKIFLPLLWHWRELDNHAFHKAYRLDRHSAAEYALATLNRELLDDLLRPLLAGFLYCTPEQTSQAMLFLLLKAGIGIRRFTLREGLGQLVARMAHSLTISTNTKVQCVISNQIGGYTVFAHSAGRERRVAADGIVCAMPATEVPVLLPSLNSKQRAFFESISYSSTVIAAIGLSNRGQFDFQSALVGRHRKMPKCLAAITSLAAKNLNQVPPGCDLIRWFSSGPAGKALLDKDDDIIRRAFHEDLSRMGLPYPSKSQEIFFRVDRWPQAVPRFDVGHFRRLKCFADAEIESERIVFAGDYLTGPFIEGAIASGSEAGQRLLSRLHQ